MGYFFHKIGHRARKTELTFLITFMSLPDYDFTEKNPKPVVGVNYCLKIFVIDGYCLALL